jgi:hypothetical protein
MNCHRSRGPRSSSMALGRGNWLQNSSPSPRRATQRVTASCFSRTAFSSLAIIWIGTGMSGALRPSRTIAGIPGRNRLNRWHDWPSIASSGCCRATANGRIWLRKRCERTLCDWRGRCAFHLEFVTLRPPRRAAGDNLPVVGRTFLSVPPKRRTGMSVLQVILILPVD